jgi:purine-binding chemotaxis protein CheW
MSEHGRDDSEAPRLPAEDAGAAAPRELAVMRAGGRVFAVYADEADSVTEGLRPTPLPGAPPAVLGVVCVRGRMRTVLDPRALFGDTHRAPPDAAPPPTPPRFVVALRGDEQLALAVERVERIVEAPPDALRPPPDDKHTAAPLRGLVILDDTPVAVLDPARLFEAAMQGTERRRPRTP